MSTRKAKLPKGIYKRTLQKGTVYMALVRLAGFKAVSKTFGTAAEATEWSEATKRELATTRKRGPTRADLPRLTVGDLAREYLADPAILGLTSFETYHDRLDWWVLKYGTTRISEVGPSVLREARTALMAGHGVECPLSPATVNRYLAALRAAWNWGRAAELVPQDRSWPTKLMLKEPRGRTRCLTDGELERLLAAARKRGPTEYAMLVVSLATGMRQSELLRLSWSDMDFERSRMRVMLSKNKESRGVHLPATAIEALKAIRKGGVVSPRHCFLNTAGTPHKKDTVAYWWNLVRNEAGVTDFRWHDLRHSCASFLAQQGASLPEIGSVLGHKSPAATHRYAHLVQGAPVTGHAALDEKLRGK